MSDRFQRVDPTPFDAAPQAAAEAGAAPGRGLAAMSLPILAVLIVAALFVFFLLPQLIEPGEPPAATSVASAPSASGPGTKPAPDREDSGAAAASPYADALEARARAEAQELLEELIDVREGLEARGALEWGEAEMAAIAEAANSGDEQYREREFEAAIESYRKALDSALALEASLPERFAAELVATDAAIEALDADDANAALAAAELLEPGAPELASRRARVEALDELIAAVETAEAAEAEGDLATAVDAMRGASERDPEHQRIAAELARLQIALTTERFNAAMSEGYAALDGTQFDRAEARFRSAAKLRPGSEEAQAALRELGVARIAAQLKTLQSQAEVSARAEDWDDAIKRYEEALAIDGSLRFAREGLTLARPRAEVDRALTAIIDDPARLVDDAILREARESLAAAQNLPEPGPRLSGQLDQVRDIIAIASKPLPVRLRSDGETEVTVYKVARLGRFDERQLELRPGAYVAVGRRPRYRDVRVEFTVSPESQDAVFVACSEPISFP
ncbi:MAG: hypothetical protein AAGA95_04430 [Pseudomonadota bacterium]